MLQPSTKPIRWHYLILFADQACESNLSSKIPIESRRTPILSMFGEYIMTIINFRHEACNKRIKHQAEPFSIAILLLHCDDVFDDEMNRRYH